MNRFRICVSNANKVIMNERVFNLSRARKYLVWNVHSAFFGRIQHLELNL